MSALLCEEAGYEGEGEGEGDTDEDRGVAG